MHKLSLPRNHLLCLPDAARAFHESLYRQKLTSLLEKKKLSESDDEELRKMQVGAGCIQCWRVNSWPRVPPAAAGARVAEKQHPPPLNPARSLLPDSTAVQVMLCIQNEERDRMHTELCGQIFKDAVNNALAAGELPGG